LTVPGDVDRAVDGVDFVLHPAAMIPPAADHHPAAAKAVNVGGARNLLDSIARQPRGNERIAFVNVATVAQYGHRLPPVETIRVGDPMKPNSFDYYAVTKGAAERMVAESELARWVSLRQTFIVFPNLLTLVDPILFLQPLEQRVEFITSRDAGYGLVQCLETGDDFWGNFYNMSGGPECRVVFKDFLDRLFHLFGVGDYRKVFDRNWFALYGAHCGFFEDSHVLDAHLGHFRDSYDDYCEQVDREAAAWLKWGARLAPTALLRVLARSLAQPPRWIARGEEDRIRAFFGSREAWARIPDWEGET
ncbi:MAG: NAD-dependent epimerase/dehydratase family protein, partial [Myxococcota bacterium]